MIAVPRIPKVQDGQILSTNLVNHIIKRTEYAGDLLRQYKCVAGTEISVAQEYDGTLVSAGLLDEGNSFFIGIAAATGGAFATQTIDSFSVNGKRADIQQALGTASFLGGTTYRLTSNEGNQVGAVWHQSRVSLFSFSATFNYLIGGSSNADGFTLIFCPSFFLAGNGGGLGYQGAPVNSVAVEIDIFQNEFDPDNSHIAILGAGNVINHLAIASRTVRPSGSLGVNYSNKTLIVLHNGIQIISHPIDLQSIVGA